MESVLKVAVLTDLHAVGESGSQHESWVSSVKKPEEPCPFRSLESLISESSIKADYLLCCGDIANKSNFSGQQYAWNKLQEIGQQLNVREVIGTVGNHDVDSRYDSSDFDPKGNLMSLSPGFPGVSEMYANQYWARNFSIITGDEYLILNINSCAFHGYGRSDANEWQHGRVSKQTLCALRTELQKPEYKLEMKIAFFHHHPIKWDKVAGEDFSEMQGGNELVQIFSECTDGQWLIIHGHKHYPNILYAHGSANAPTIVSAGSFSSKRTFSHGTGNQFYILELYKNSFSQFEMPLAGVVKAWTWQNLAGWSPAKESEGIPDEAGFGWKENPQTIAKIVSEIVESNHPNYTNWNEITSRLSKIKFTLPSDMKMVTKILDEKYNITVMLDSYGKYKMLAKGTGNGK